MTTPAADSSRRSLVRRRESWMRAAWRLHGEGVSRVARHAADAAGVIVAAIVSCAVVVGWLWASMALADWLTGHAGELEAAAAAMAVAVGVPIGVALVGSALAAAFDINASRRYLDEDGGPDA